MNVLLFTLLALLATAGAIDLGDAAPYAILAGSTVTSAGAIGTDVTGDVGLAPGSDITGFPPAVHTGTKNVANGAAEAAKASLTTAYNAAAGAAVTADYSSVDLKGMTLTGGVYKFADTAALNGVLTLDGTGDSTSSWIFQVGSSLLFALDSRVELINGAQADNVYFQVGTSATLENNAAVQGNIMADQVTMNSNVVTLPAEANSGAQVRAKTHLRSE
eukprot:CAMPEP_0173267312 /NCGR_PEP_ID=MMETSP1142-20121109/29697_1 /TAXON_ID=483371 /ORGANISM="non described non described, Strain CCMP2298" /LENGTH=217 /DNA_ID=CAMNT_0014203421 /DNA_START=53 /DNA_END=706 /DNA_ORIENTATION=+